MHILYATDGSEGALAAAQLLASLPLDTNCQLTILSVVPLTEAVDGQAVLASTCEALSCSSASLTTQVRRGNAAEELLRATEEHPTDLIVVGASGRAPIARFFVGSVAERVARHAPCSVLVARPIHGGLGKLIVGVDGSAGAAHALEWLERFPLPDGSEIRLLSVLPRMEDLTRTSRLLPLPLMGSADARAFIERMRRQIQELLDKWAAAFAALDRRAITDIRRGDPAPTLLEAADDEAADLIVVGSQGHSGFERFMMGSVSEKVLRHAHCSVLVVR